MRENVKQHVIPGVDGPWQAPVDAVVVHRPRLIRPVPVPAGVAVRPLQHRHRRVHEHHIHAPRRRLHRRLAELLYLLTVEVPLQLAHRSRLVDPVRPLARTVPACVVRAALEVRHGRHRAQDRLPAEAHVVERPERRPERHPVRVPVRCEVGGDVERDVPAADELPALVEVGLPREPVRR
jgi:hypothetical protein